MADVSEEESQRRKDLCGRNIAAIKITLLFVIWIIFTWYIILTPDHKVVERLVPLKANEASLLSLEEDPRGDEIMLIAKGKIHLIRTINENTSEDHPHIKITLQIINTATNASVWKAKSWNVFLNDEPTTELVTVKKTIGFDKNILSDNDLKIRIELLNNHKEPVGISLTIKGNPMDTDAGVVLGLLLLVFLYTLIGFELTDRTFAAIIVSLTALGILCLLDARPSMATIISWIDMNTLMLLFGMMAMVAILLDTGLFDYISVFAFGLSRGNIWLLLTLLYIFTALVSAFLDNVTMVLLMVPVTIRLSEILAIDATTVIINIAIFSNIGGTLTPVGDPPNVIIATNPYVTSSGINFGTFTLHMLPGVVFAMLVALVVIHYMTRKVIYSRGPNQTKMSIESLEKYQNSIRTKNNSDISRRLADLKDRLRAMTEKPDSDFQENLAELKSKYKIKDKVLLYKCCIAIGFAIMMFFLHSLPSMKGITLAWAAILAALLLLILSNRQDIDSILDRIEWPTLLFFAALFILMEALVELGVIDWVGDRTTDVIMGVEEKNRLTVAILMLIWISAITSAFVDNIPITTMMIKLAIKLGSNEQLKVSFSPLVWALAFGACFGGNGTLIGASANVVSAGIAKQHGYTIKFVTFMMIGFPVMIATVLVASIYLLLAHCALKWH